MAFSLKQKFGSAFILFITLVGISGCLTSKKVDKYVGEQFNNELPKPDKKKNKDISITSNVQSGGHLSSTETKTSNVLPLIIYWHWDYKNTCTLNPAIGVNVFTKTVNLQAIGD